MNWINPTRPELTRLSVLITFIFGALLILAAWNPPDMVIWLNLLAFGGLEAVFLWPLVLGLYWKKANACGALSSMLAGAGCYIYLISYNIKIFDFQPIVPTLLLGLIVFIIANHFGKTLQNRD